MAEALGPAESLAGGATDIVDFEAHLASETTYLNWPLERSPKCYRRQFAEGHRYYLWLRDLPLGNFSQAGHVGRERKRWKNVFLKAKWTEEHLERFIHQSDHSLLLCIRDEKDMPERDIVTTEHAARLPYVLFMLHHSTKSQVDRIREDSATLWRFLVSTWRRQSFLWRLTSGETVQVPVTADELVQIDSLKKSKWWDLPRQRTFRSGLEKRSEVDLAFLAGLVIQHSDVAPGLFLGLGDMAEKQMESQWETFKSDILQAEATWLRIMSTPGGPLGSMGGNSTLAPRYLSSSF